MKMTLLCEKWISPTFGRNRPKRKCHHRTAAKQQPFWKRKKGQLLRPTKQPYSERWLRFADCALLSALRLPYKLTESTPCDLAGGEQEAQEGCSR